MASRVFGNRPDCAYYLLLGLCVAAMFTAFGGIFTYIGYWPQVVFHHHYHHHYHNNNNSDVSHPPSSSSSSSSSNSYYEYGVSAKSIEIYSIMGPVLLVIGIGIALLVGVLAIKYDCEYEPEEPKTAILRLASEMSLNLSHGGDSKYELMTNMTPTGVSDPTSNNNFSSSNHHHHHPSDNLTTRSDFGSPSSSSSPSLPVV